MEPVSLEQQCDPQAAMILPRGEEVASRPPHALLVNVKSEDAALVKVQAFSW